MSDMQDPDRQQQPGNYPGLFAEAAQPQEEGRSRLPRVALAGLLFAVMVGGVAWYGFQSMGPAADPDSPVPVVQADSEPVKTRPEEPGGMQIPDRDKRVYDRFGDAPARSGVEHLLPPPEAPLPPPEPPLAPPQAAELPPDAAPPAPPPLVPGPITTIPGDGGTAESLRMPPPVPPVTPPAPATAAAPPAASPPVPLTPPSAQPPAAVPAQPAPPAVASAPGGAFQVQLGAVRDEQAARQEWARLKQRNGDVLGDLELDIERADLGSRGIFFRVRGGPLADEAAAKRVCDALKPRNVGCLVVR